MKCSVCGSTEKLVHHHISYEPEKIEILCRRHHRLTHWKNRNIRMRPSNFKSKLYHDTASYQPFYRNLGQKHIARKKMYFKEKVAWHLEVPPYLNKQLEKYIEVEGTYKTKSEFIRVAVRNKLKKEFEKIEKRKILMENSSLF